MSARFDPRKQEKSVSSPVSELELVFRPTDGATMLEVTGRRMDAGVGETEPEITSMGELRATRSCWWMAVVLVVFTDGAVDGMVVIEVVVKSAML